MAEQFIEVDKLRDTLRESLETADTRQKDSQQVTAGVELSGFISSLPHLWSVWSV